MSQQATTSEIRLSQQASTASQVEAPPIHVAFGVDSGYFRGMGVAITSILQRNPGQRFVFHVFAFSVSPDSRRRIDAMAAAAGLDVRIHVLDEHLLDAFHRFPCFSQHSLGTFIRLLIPNLLEGVTRRVLYLDADLLCFGDVSAIIQVDLDHAIAAAVHDQANTTARSQIAALGLAKAEYFNAGVMYINVDKWIEADIQTQALTVLSSRDLVFADQDALNVALNGQVAYIGDQWNCRYHLVDYTSRGEAGLTVPAGTVFMHFTGPVKPWHDWCLHQAREVFAALQAQSAWADMPLEPPVTARQLKLYSKSLWKHKRILAGIAWHAKYLYKRSPLGRR